VKPGRKLSVGATFAHPRGVFSAEIIAREPDGSAIVRFATSSAESITEVANRVGDVPLPPYISRESAGSEHDVERVRDLERYQTVYANRGKQVAVAAPTAGLHFTPELLASLSEAGIQFADVTLHVGLGTFRPITTPTVDAHPIHREVYEIPPKTQRALFPPLAGRRIAVGTTTVRSVEDFLSQHDQPLSDESGYIAEASLFVYPPAQFRGVDALITNFHQPRSTLMCLVAAFLAPRSMEGIPWLQEIYAEAIAREYRFFSYGDAMLIL
jgi:S-adenosylmethionine:tRNA ribosyltransferase-isomerase